MSSAEHDDRKPPAIPDCGKAFQSMSMEEEDRKRTAIRNSGVAFESMSSENDELKFTSIPDSGTAKMVMAVRPNEDHPKKPALKKKSKTSKTDRHLKWDEEVIQEHDLLRGTRMNIDEPNTPFAYYDSGAESDDSRRARSPANQKQVISWDNLTTRLESVAAVREAYPSSPSSYAETDHSDVEEHKNEIRRKEFREHRKRHYNEMERVKQFRMENPDDEEDGEDAGDDADVED